MPQRLKQLIRDLPDFPKQGIVFKDITPLLANGPEYQRAIGLMAERYRDRSIDCVAAVESRGFLFGAPLACALSAGFVPVRKQGKLPHPDKIAATYQLEYGSATLEMHRDALLPSQRVLLVDDLLATGGTALAVSGMVERLGAQLVEAAFLIELSFLQGRKKLSPCPVFSLIRY